MEKLSTHTSEKRNKIAHKAITLALSGALILGNVSCGNTPQKDVMKQEAKVENLSFQLSHYISARKDFVEKYNKLLKYPKTKSNEADINNSLSQLYEVIVDYDKKIANLAKDKINAEVDLNKDIANLGNGFSLKGPIDPDKWDFLLAIQ